MSKKVFRKEYTDKNGEKKVLEYEYDTNVLTHNQQLTQNLDTTIKSWLDEGFEMITDIDKIKELEPGAYVRYITTDNKARKGGYLSQKDDKYMMLLNRVNGVKWSVQYDNLKSVFIKRPKKVKVKVNKKDDKKDEEDNDNDDENKEEELSRADKLLNDLYYKEKNFISADKLYKTIKERFPDEKITRKMVRDFISKQEIHQITKYQKNKSNQRAILPKDYFNVVYVDLIDFTKKENKKKRNIYKYLFVAMDGLSKYGFVIPLVNKTETTIVKALDGLIKSVNKNIGAIVSDNGKEFKNEKVRNFLSNRREPIKHIYSLAYNPNSNIVEVLNKTIKNMLNKIFIINGNDNWIDNIDDVIKNYNNNVHSSTGYSPQYLIDNIDNRDLKNKIYERLRKRTTNIKDDNQYEIGDLVRLVEINRNKLKKNPIRNTMEVFEIIKKIRGNQLKPVRYKVKALDGEIIEGFFNYNDLVYVPPDTNYI